MNQESNDQQQPVATATPEIESHVSLQRAATACGVKEDTLRKWCKRKHIKWQQVQNGAKITYQVMISDVRAYLTKRNPSTVSTAGSPPAMPLQAETTTSPQVPAAVPQEPASGAEPDSPPTAPTHVPARADQAASSPATTGTASVTPAMDATAAVPQSTAAAKQAASHPPASPKQKTKPPRAAPSGLLVHRAKNSMRKFGAEELQKLAAWIKQRLANKFASNTNPDPSKQPTPAS